MEEQKILRSYYLKNITEEKFYRSVNGALKRAKPQHGVEGGVALMIETMPGVGVPDFVEMLGKWGKDEKLIEVSIFKEIDRNDIYSSGFEAWTMSYSVGDVEALIPVYIPIRAIKGCTVTYFEKGGEKNGGKTEGRFNRGNC